MEKKDLIIPVAEEEFAKVLINALNKGSYEDKMHIAKVISQNLFVTEVGVERTIQAALGIFPTSKYQIGSACWVHYKKLYYWKFNIEDCFKNKIIVKDHILCHIIDICHTKRYPYKVSYRCINEESSVEILEGYLEENVIIPADEFDFTMASRGEDMDNI